MQKIIAIAADYQHVINYCKDKNMLPNRFVHAINPEKLKGLRNYNYIVVTEPYNEDIKKWREMQIQFRMAGAIRLPLDINEWSLLEFA